MLEFIQLLNQRYQTILSQSCNEASKFIYQQRIDEMILTEAFMRKGCFINNNSSAEAIKALKL